MASKIKQGVKVLAFVILMFHFLLFGLYLDRYVNLHVETLVTPVGVDENDNQAGQYNIMIHPKQLFTVAVEHRLFTQRMKHQTAKPKMLDIIDIIADTRDSYVIQKDAKNTFVHYDLHNPPMHFVQNDTTKYFMDIGDMTCFIIGTDTNATAKAKSKCQCKSGWFGKWCSFPEMLKHSSYPGDVSKLTIRKEQPRRLLSAMPFNIEFEITEARFADLGSIVDVFLIAESEYSGHGDRKPLRLFNKLQKGFLKEWHHKIVYVYLDYFPKAAYKNGWIADDLPRDHIGTQGMRNQVRGTKHDDIFILFDTDEVPTYDALLFFKLHDGWPEPFGFTLWKTTYGFFWKGDSGVWPMMGGSTVGMLSHVFEYKASKLRNPQFHLSKLGINIKAYMKAGANIHMWKIGRRDHYAGWHCSWCFDVEGIRIKLVSAINADFPRWGDYPEKQDLDYIKSLVRKGMWFDNKRKMDVVKPVFHMYAQPYILKNKVKFKFLLENPYT